MLIRTTAANHLFQTLVSELDAELKIRDGDEHLFYAPLNQAADLPYAVVAYDEGVATGCGAIRPYGTSVMEIKRMYIRQAHRGKGIASHLLRELELWAASLNCHTCILETGKNQPEAIRLYHKNHYHVIPNYGPYAHTANSICFQKEI